MVVNDSGKKSFKTTSTVGFQSFCGVKENRRGIIMFQDFCWTSSTTGKISKGKQNSKKLLFKHLFTITFLSASIVRDSTNLFYSSFTICQFCSISNFQFCQFSILSNFQFCPIFNFCPFFNFCLIFNFCPIFNFVSRDRLKLSILLFFQSR